MRFPSGPSNIGTIVKQSAWRNLYPASKLRELIQSSKPITVFLDANDSDFSSYVVDTLRGDSSVLSYYSIFFPMKQRQNTLSQILLSLLFLEANNTRTDKSFAEDFLTASQTPRRFIMKYRIPGRTGEVFEALLFGSPIRKHLSIKFLKCMTCERSELKKIGMYRDLRDVEMLAHFFTDVVRCFKGESRRETRDLRCPIVMCFCDIPIEELDPDSLRESKLEKIFNATIRSCVKFWLISRGKLGEFNKQLSLDSGDDSISPFQFEGVPLLYRKKFRQNISKRKQPVDLVELCRNVINEVDKQGNIVSKRKIGDLISNRTLEEFIDILLAGVDEGLSVSKFSVDFSSLLELALQIDPNALTSEHIEEAFSTRLL